MYMIDMDKRTIEKIGSEKKWEIEPYDDDNCIIEDDVWANLDVQSRPVRKTLFSKRNEFEWLYKEKIVIEDCLIPIYRNNRRALLVPVGVKSKIRDGACEMAYVSGFEGHVTDASSLTSVMFDDRTDEFVIPFCVHVDFDDDICHDIRMLRIKAGF